MAEPPRSDFDFARLHVFSSSPRPASREGGEGSPPSEGGPTPAVDPGFNFAKIPVFPTATAASAEGLPEPSGHPRVDSSSVATAAPLPPIEAALGSGLTGDSCARLHWGPGQRLGSYRAAG